jgi:protein TonB
VKEGDLVQAGPGVRPPVLVSFNKPEYPPIARRMKVEGTVVLALLVDESGKVLDVRLERGVQQNVGINEAATSAGRSARFNPATKDGVRVKMWYQLTIPFRL